MEFNIKRAGTSARQESGNNLSSSLCSYLPAFICVLFLAACHERTPGQTAQDSKVKRDSLYQPKVNIKVNRHFDEKGNMIGFDSTYTSFYSNIEGDTISMDSMMSGFDKYFNIQHPQFLQREFAPLFFTDSLRYPDFFHRDYFMKRYELNDQYMRDMMQRMDSIKNEYFEKESKNKQKPKSGS
jgi:hypothetical protein